MSSLQFYLIFEFIQVHRAKDSGLVISSIRNATVSNILRVYILLYYPWTVDTQLVSEHTCTAYTTQRPYKARVVWSKCIYLRTYIFLYVCGGVVCFNCIHGVKAVLMRNFLLLIVSQIPTTKSISGSGNKCKLPDHMKQTTEIHTDTQWRIKHTVWPSTQNKPGVCNNANLKLVLNGTSTTAL